MRKQLTNKKGFTMVELIVVVAIIGVMAGVVIAGMNNSGTTAKANENAKAFYYNLQDVFIKYKANDENNMTEGFYTKPGDTAVYAKAATGVTAETFVFIEGEAVNGKGFTSLKVGVGTAGKASLTAGFTDDTLMASLNSLMADGSEGFYFAMIDSQCRVKAAYWSYTKYEELSEDAQPMYTDGNYVDTVLVGAYPVEKYYKDEIIMK